MIPNRRLRTATDRHSLLPGGKASLSVPNEKETLMELTVAKPQEEKVDFAVLYGGKVIA
jgi:hypothetical protein